MHLFYCPDITPPLHPLTEEESKHCIRVLRLRQNDIIHITDGKGSLHECRIQDDHPKKCTVEVIHSVSSMKRKPDRLHVAIAPTKNAERLEWFLEKATEIGIDEITPVFCSRSERTVLKPERLEKVLISAMKQSLQSWLPQFNDPLDFNSFITRPYTGQKFIAWCETGKEQLLRETAEPGRDILILIGPEGDFSPDEVKVATEKGFIAVSLGDHRLRTETAGVVACCMLMDLK